MAKRKIKKPTPLGKTAYHEAGHVVAFHLQHRRFKYVTITPDRETGTLGLVAFYQPPESFDPEIKVDAPAKRRIEKDVFVYFCGEAAEKIFCGRHNWKWAGADLCEAVELATYLYPDPDVFNAWVNFKIVQARQELRSEYTWPIVEALARELLNHNRIEYKQAKSIMKEAEELAFDESFERSKAGNAWRDPLGK